MGFSILYTVWQFIMALFFSFFFAFTQALWLVFFLGHLHYNLTVKFNKCNFFQFYRFFKSGLLFDFFLKRVFLRIGFYLFKLFNIEFSEKYFVENIFFKPTIILKYVKNFFNLFSRNLIFNILPIILLVIFFSFIVLGVM